MITLIKIDGLPCQREFDAMPWGRQTEYRDAIEAFKASACSVHLSQKRRHWRLALSEFVKMYSASEYYARFHADKANCYDDSFQIWFK